MQRHFDNNDHLCADLGRSYACSPLRVNAACVLILERRHEWYRASLDHVLTEKMDDIRESDEDDLGASSHSGDELGNRNKPEADQISSEGFVSTDSDVPAPRELLWRFGFDYYYGYENDIFISYLLFYKPYSSSLCIKFSRVCFQDILCRK